MEQNELRKAFKRRLVNYPEECPKKCFFSLYNYVAKKENSLIAFKYEKEIASIIKDYEAKKDNWEIFKKNYLESL